MGGSFSSSFLLCRLPYHGERFQGWFLRLQVCRVVLRPSEGKEPGLRSRPCGGSSATGSGGQLLPWIYFIISQTREGHVVGRAPCGSVLNQSRGWCGFLPPMAQVLTARSLALAPERVTVKTGALKTAQGDFKIYMLI